MTTRKPFVVQVWGTDVELARRVPWLARRVLRRARLVIAPSTALADEARRLGARDVRTIPSGVDLPAAVGGGGRSAGDPLRGTALAGEGRARAGRGRRRAAAGRGGRRAAAGRGSGSARLRAARRARAPLRAGRGRRLPVAQRGLRRRVRGGDGARPPRGRRRRRRPARPRRPRRDGPARSARRRRRPARRRSSGCSPIRSLRRRFGEAGRARIAEHFTWQRFGDETLRAYEDAL